MEIQHASLRLMGFKRWGYIKSLQLKVKFKKLYQAYFPTLLRDLIYGITRHFMMIQLATPGVKLSLGGEAFRIFISIAVACMASAPGNELRAYRLQPKKTRLPPGFKSARRGNWIRPFLHRVFFWVTTVATLQFWSFAHHLGVCLEMGCTPQIWQRLGKRWSSVEIGGATLIESQIMLMKIKPGTIITNI